MNKYTLRTRIFCGTLCNTNCRFCYYYLTNQKENFPVEIIKKQLLIAKKAGMQAVDFSGGEPSVHPDFIDLIKFAKNLGFKNICTLTNGYKFGKNFEFTQKCIDAGLNEVLFSIHGYNEEEHDYITQVKGSFNTLLDSYNFFQKNNILLRINCTVSKINYKNLEDHARIYSKLKPYQVNFILFNDFESAAGLAEKFAVKYSEANIYIKKAIDIMKDTIRSINVRYIPFCFLEGYEKHITNYPQKIFDPFEWSQRLLERMPAAYPLSFYKYLKHIIKTYLKTMPKIRFSIFFIEDIFVASRIKSYIKSSECAKCRFDNICQGLEKSYVDNFSTDELKAVSGQKISDPLYFRKDFYKGFEYGKIIK